MSSLYQAQNDRNEHLAERRHDSTPLVLEFWVPDLARNQLVIVRGSPITTTRCKYRYYLPI